MEQRGERSCPHSFLVIKILASVLNEFIKREGSCDLPVGWREKALRSGVTEKWSLVQVEDSGGLDQVVAMEGERRGRARATLLPDAHQMEAHQTGVAAAGPSPLRPPGHEGAAPYGAGGPVLRLLLGRQL